MIIKNCNITKLHDEFIKVGIKPFPVFTLENGDGDFTFPDGTDAELVQQIIDSHDPTPLPQEPTIEELQIEYNIDLDYRISLIEMGLI